MQGGHQKKLINDRARKPERNSDVALGTNLKIRMRFIEISKIFIFRFLLKKAA
jgi:hypothetical protein